jgi:hypothetical protein
MSEINHENPEPEWTQEDLERANDKLRNNEAHLLTDREKAALGAQAERSKRLVDESIQNQENT